MIIREPLQASWYADGLRGKLLNARDNASDAVSKVLSYFLCSFLMVAGCNNENRFYSSQN